MIEKLGTVALYVDDQGDAERFWTECVGFEVRSKRSLGETGHWIEIAPPKAESCLVLYPKALMPDWGQRKPSIVFECDEVHATVAAMKSRGVQISQEPRPMEWGPFAAFLDSEGFEHGLRGRAPPAL